MIERKCTQCGQWNKDEDYCTNCGAPLSPKAIDQAKTEKRRQEEASIEPSKFDKFLERTRTSKYAVVRWTYWFFYSLSIIAGLIGAFVAWFVAMVNA